jgi:EAL domain-containing protein (putative c-di-GMP-specific phosphodiesterase class I)
MYEAKKKGKSRYAVFESMMNSRAWKRLELEMEMRRALERDDFFLEYQPVVRLDTKQIVEVEALVRWRHSTGRLLSPLDFIPVAEQTGLILPLGRWVLREACRQVRAWQQLGHNESLATSSDEGRGHGGRKKEPKSKIGNPKSSDAPIMLSVNLSARQLKDPNFVRDLVADLTETGFDPQYLKLEITESVALGDTDTGAATLKALRDLGIHLAIDDFGTGYSALSYLKRFPVGTLKIDRAFIDGLGRNLEDTAIVRAVIAFAKTLSLTVTAEGIESAEQLSHLQELGCECGQGYYFAPPLPSFEMEEMLNGTHQLLTPLAEPLPV